MEIEITNHQDVAEPDLVASGVTGTGLKDKTWTGTALHETCGNIIKFPLVTGFQGILQGNENTHGFFCSPESGSGAGTTKIPRDLYPATPEKSRKNLLIIGMGILFNGKTTPEINRNPATAQADPDEEKEDGDSLISLFWQQEQLLDRVTNKMDRDDGRLTVLEEHRRSE